METDDLNARSLEAGTLLWHYTGFDGLEGILKGAIWASSLPYLNDTEEFRHGITIALEVLHNELVLAAGERHGAHAGAVFDQVDAFFKDRRKPRDVFVASFSRKEDDLSQWRAYGGVGPLFSIGFDPVQLERAAHKSLFELEEVKYDQRQIVADLRLALREPIDRMTAVLQEQGTTRTTIQLVTEWAADLAGELMLLTPRYKHPKFSAEEEWRLIRRQPVLARERRLALQFRRSESLVVPYIACPLHTPGPEAEVMADGTIVASPIAAIVIGPSPHPDELEYAVGEMTARIGLSVRVTCSTVPFRNW